MNPPGRFRFPLTTLLQVRRLKEEAARLDLVQAQARTATSRQGLTAAQNLLRARLEALTRPAPEACPAADFLRRLKQVEQLHATLNGWRDRLAQDEAEAGRKQRVLVSRYQERHLLERLEAKALARFQRDCRRDAERTLEDLVLCRHPALPEPGPD
jgi:flagellar export protein FliJ